MSTRASDWLKQKRIAAGYRKQSALASAINLGRGAIGNWESGRGGPSPANVPALAAALGVTQAEIVEQFGIQMHGELQTPAPPWVDQLRKDLVADIVREIDARMVNDAWIAAVAAKIEARLGQSQQPGGGGRLADDPSSQGGE